MAGKRKESQNVFSLAFVDVFACTLGALAFILILVILMIAGVVPPIINTQGLPVAFSGEYYELWFSSGKGNGEYKWSLHDGKLPEGMGIVDSTTGHLAGIPMLPSGEKSHTYDFEILLESEGGDTTKNYQLTVYANQSKALEITTQPELPKAIKNENYPLTFGASGGRPPYYWRFTQNIGGLSLKPNGQIEGIVNANAGTYALEVNVRDSNGASKQMAYQLEVVDIPDDIEIPPIVIKTDSIPAAIVGKKYRYKLALAAEGGLAPYKWECSDNLPSGMQWTEDGYLKGTAIQEGAYSIRLTVGDSRGETANSTSLKWKVLPEPRDKIEPLVILTPSSIPDAQAERTYTLAFSATGGTPPYNWTLKDVGNLPDNAKIQSSGIFQQTIEEAKKYHFTIAVKDALDLTAEKEIEWQITPNIPDVEIVMESLPDAVKGFEYYCFPAVEGGYPPFEWTVSEATPLPTGVILENGLLKGSPIQAWRGKVELSVSDFLENTTTQTVHFEVLESGKDTIASKLELLTDTVPTLLTGNPLEVGIVYQGGTPPLDWELEGALPNGLQFKDGFFKGNPREQSLQQVTVKATDQTGQVARQTFQIQSKTMVNHWWWWIAMLAAVLSIVFLLLAIWFWWLLKRNQQQDLSIITTSIPNARASFPYKCFLSAIGGVPPYRWSVSDGELPVGLSLSSEGILEGVPFKEVKIDEVKEVSFEVTVMDAIGNTSKQSL